jgi:hypothetical protein
VTVNAPPAPALQAPVRGIPIVAVCLVIAAVFGCSIYANLAFTVTNAANFQWFPPFKRYLNENKNDHLGGEYINIARSMVKGDGFAHPFDGATGPTAWMPPVLSTVLAGLLLICGGNRDAVMAVVVFLQVFVLIGTGLLVLALARQTTSRAGACVAATVFVAGLICHFNLCFQFTHDSWLVLLAVDLLIAGLWWFRPLKRWQSAVGWGLFGGLCALINPIVGLTWGVVSLVVWFRDWTWARLATAVLAAGLMVAPWSVRNYVVFGRLIPIKSNVVYELYQSQCLQPDGLLQGSTFIKHPYCAKNLERQEYAALGEMAFLDRKREQFWQAVRANPADFLKRVGDRFLGATLWYVPFDRPKEIKRPWAFWLSRLTHPLPFLGLLVLILSAFWQRLHWVQGAVIGVYLLYLLPYIGVSYYDRYAIPLLGVKVLLVIWGADRLVSLWPKDRIQSAKPGVSLRSARAGTHTRGFDSLLRTHRKKI